MTVTKEQARAARQIRTALVRARLKRNIDRMPNLTDEDRAELLESELAKAMAPVERPKRQPLTDWPLPGEAEAERPRANRQPFTPAEPGKDSTR